MDGVWQAIEDLREAIDALTMHDRIQRAVAAALRDHDRNSEVRSATVFTRREKLYGMALAGVAILLTATDLALRVILTWG